LLLATEKKLLNVENHRQLAILQLTYNTERKEKDNQVLRKENELIEMTVKRKSTFLWLIIALLFSSILFCLFIYNRFYSKAKANKKLEVLNSKIIKQNITLEKLNKELNIANDEKDKLFSIIAHELRNPLYWFQNLAEVLSKKYNSMSPDQIQKSLVALDESAKNAFHLMDNLLHWSRSKLNRISAKKINIDLGPSIISNIRMYETIMQYKNISMETNIAEGTIINADEDLFNCIIRNLISNAIKYTPVNGTISVTSIEYESFHTIMVSDTGCGIPGKMVKKLFNLNENVSLPGLMDEKGSGFGLKLCKEFVELHGGRIWVENKHEQGSSFHFTMPKACIN
jgi:signal transduction histidine kinase